MSRYLQNNCCIYRVANTIATIQGHSVFYNFRPNEELKPDQETFVFDPVAHKKFEETLGEKLSREPYGAVRYMALTSDVAQRGSSLSPYPCPCTYVDAFPIEWGRTRLLDDLIKDEEEYDNEDKEELTDEESDEEFKQKEIKEGQKATHALVVDREYEDGEMHPEPTLISKTLTLYFYEIEFVGVTTEYFSPRYQPPEGYGHITGEITWYE